eukprot:14690195-Alexandrium_andersonii.AAC.1
MVDSPLPEAMHIEPEGDTGALRRPPGLPQLRQAWRALGLALAESLEAAGACLARPRLLAAAAGSLDDA